MKTTRTHNIRPYYFIILHLTYTFARFIKKQTLKFVYFFFTKSVFIDWWSFKTGHVNEWPTYSCRRIEVISHLTVNKQSRVFNYITALWNADLERYGVGRRRTWSKLKTRYIEEHYHRNYIEPAWKCRNRHSDHAYILEPVPVEPISDLT